MALELSRLQCPRCQGRLAAVTDRVDCQACGDSYPILDGDVVDFVQGAFATQLDPHGYDAGIDDRAAFDGRQQIRRCLAERWPSHLGNVVEIGCGTGAFSRAMLEHDAMHDIVLTDVSPEMLQVCRRHLVRRGLASVVPITFATYSSHEPCLRDAGFDTCIGTQVLHHIPDVEGFLNDALRFLKPGGRALFVEPNGLFIQAVALTLADVLAHLLAQDATHSPDRQLLHNWIAEARRGALHQGDMAFLAALEDKHMFVGEEFVRAACRVGFASGEALPCTPDPTAANFIPGLMAALGVNREFGAGISRAAAQYAPRHMQRLDGRDTSQSYAFWLVKGAQANRHPRAAADCAATRRHLGAMRSVAVVSGDPAPPRWDIGVTVDLFGDALRVQLVGWCLLPGEARWIRISIGDVAREAAIWLPRADVHLGLNGAGDYAAWNALCCGVNATLLFDDLAAAMDDPIIRAELVAMDGTAIETRIPPRIQLGEAFSLGAPLSAVDTERSSIAMSTASTLRASQPTGAQAPLSAEPPAVRPPDTVAQPRGVRAGAFRPDITLPALWTDRPNWRSQLRAVAATGVIDQADADHLAHFAEHGWLLMPQAIDPVLIDAFVRDIRKLHEMPGMFVTTDFRSSREQKLNGNQPDAYESLFDLYVNLQTARNVCMHARISRFLALVFKAKVLAFQQLLFQRSNGHLWHQDTSVVVVDTPTLLVATWIALQDIVEGSGELAYYDRSHRLPHYMFNDGRTKHHEEYDAIEYASDLEVACESRQLAYGRLLAKKGDVFFWTADLVHRSHPRSLPEETPRLSCVTHYCPATSMPGYFSDPELRGIEPFWDVGGFASALYKLPNLSRPVRPVPRWQFYN